MFHGMTRITRLFGVASTMCRSLACILVVIWGGCGNGDSSAPPSPPPPSPPFTGSLVTVDTLVRHQIMEGWEAVAQLGQEVPGYMGWRDAVLDLAVTDLGLNRLRIEVRSGSENPQDHFVSMLNGTASNWRCQRWESVNDNADPNVLDPAGFHFSELDTSMVAVVLPMKQRMEARGEHLYLNLNYLAFLGQCAAMPYAQSTPAEYAEFMLAVFLHLRDAYGVVPDAVELILEPDNGTPWASGTLIGQALVATAARLAAGGFHPKFIAPSTANMGNAVGYFDALRQVPGALAALGTLSYHRYGGVSDANLTSLGQRASIYGVRTAMLEHIGSGVDDLYKDLTVGQVSAWQQFAMAYPNADNGGTYYPIISGQPQLGSRTRYLRQYFRYVRLGAQRVGASSTSGALRPVAFRNPDGRLAVVIHADQTGALTVRGLRPGQYGVSLTSSPTTTSELGTQTAGANGTLSFTTSATGVLTVYAK